VNKTGEKLAGAGVKIASGGGLVAFLNSSQLFVLCGLFSIIGFILWLTQPSSVGEQDEQEIAIVSSSRRQTGAAAAGGEAADDRTSPEDETDGSSWTNRELAIIRENAPRGASTASSSNNAGQQQRRRNNGQKLNSSPKYSIDTIYESHNEIYEEKSVFSYDFKVKSGQYIGDGRTSKLDNTSVLKTQSVYSAAAAAAANQTGSNLSPSTEDMVDRILDDLITDDMENYAYNRHHKSLVKQDSMSFRNDSSKDSTGSTNSLLGFLLSLFL
jgi:hypothetical protein